MKYFLALILLTPSAFASTLFCRGPEHELFLSIDFEKKAFTFHQHCWNPCNMGGGTVGNKMIGWAGIRYALELTNSQELITPMETRKYTLLMDFGMTSGALYDKTGSIDLECEVRNE